MITRWKTQTMPSSASSQSEFEVEKSDSHFLEDAENTLLRQTLALRGGGILFSLSLFLRGWIKDLISADSLNFPAADFNKALSHNARIDRGTAGLSDFFSLFVTCSIEMELQID